jgi:hypothetical protein
VLDTNIISDYTYDKWAKELEQLMKDHPDAYSDRFDFAFERWDSASGFDLPMRDPWVLQAAERLLKNTHP